MIEKTANLAKYVEQAAQLMELSLTREYLPGVIDNFTRIAAIAPLVTEFNLPEEIEAAPTFEP